MFKHPSRIEGMSDLVAYLRFWGIAADQAKIKRTCRDTEGAWILTERGKTQVCAWEPQHLDVLIRALVGVDFDLWVRQCLRDRARDHKAQVDERQKRRVAAGGRPKGLRGAKYAAFPPIPAPSQATAELVTHARIVDGVEVETAQANDAYPIHWGAARVATDAEIANRGCSHAPLASLRLTAYVMRRGHLSRLGRAPDGTILCGDGIVLLSSDGMIPVGATDNGKRTWADVRAEVDAAWHDALWWIHEAPVRPQPTATGDDEP